MEYCWLLVKSWMFLLSLYVFKGSDGLSLFIFFGIFDINVGVGSVGYLLLFNLNDILYVGWLSFSMFYI